MNARPCVVFLHACFFELRGSTYAKKAEVVKLDAFVVSSEREGNAQAIMDQRAALNFKQVVATDNFGEVTSGNVGEFVKYMPGIVIDYLTRGPLINSVSFRVGPKITRRDSFGANFDYKVSARWVFALRTAGSHLNDEYINRTINFTAAAAQIDPASTLTKVIARPAPNNVNTRMEDSQGHRNRLNDTVTYTPKLIRYNHPKFNLQLRATWQAAKINAFANHEVRWHAERLLADLSGAYKINRTYELTLAGRNINNAFQDYYSNQPGLLRSREILGPVWTLGVRGRF